jgi:hypothetical protein
MYNFLNNIYKLLVAERKEGELPRTAQGCQI